MTDDIKIRDRFWKELAASPFLMVGLDAGQAHSLPMTAQLDKDASHEFWFYTSKDNRLAAGGLAMAQYSAKGHDLFACIHGTLVEETDPAVIDKYWSNQVEAWYPGGRSDPSLLMLRFELGDAEIWTADLGITGLFKLMTGGDLLPDMKGQHAEVAL